MPFWDPLSSGSVLYLKYSTVLIVLGALGSTVLNCTYVPTILCGNLTHKSIFYIDYIKREESNSLAYGSRPKVGSVIGRDFSLCAYRVTIQ